MQDNILPFSFNNHGMSKNYLINAERAIVGRVPDGL